MIKRLLCLLLATFLTVSCVKATPHNSTKIAVFASSDLAHNFYSSGHRLGYVYSAQSFDEFDTFLKTLKEVVKNQNVTIDLAVHGSPQNGLLVVVDKKGRLHYTNMGMLLNHIEKYFHPVQLTVLTECCYAPYVYRHSMRGVIKVWNKYTYTENYEGTVPQYPVYGLKYYIPNYVSMTLEEYIHGDSEYTCDLRDFDEADIPHDDYDLLYKMNNKLDDYHEKDFKDSI